MKTAIRLLSSLLLLAAALSTSAQSNVAISALPTVSTVASNDYVILSTAAGGARKAAVSNLLAGVTGVSSAVTNQWRTDATNAAQAVSGAANVRDYGAYGLGNPAQDDWLAIQTCIESNRNTRIYLPAGTYYLSQPLVLYERQSLAGADQVNWPLSGGTTLAPMATFPATVTGANIGRSAVADGMRSALVISENAFTAAGAWWHLASIESLGLDCRTQDINGLWLDSPGENSKVERVIVRNGRTGLLITGSPIPAYVNQLEGAWLTEGLVRITGHTNATFKDAYGQASFYNCSCDYVDTAPFIVEGGVSVLVDRFKHEYGYTNKVNPLVLIRGNWDTDPARCAIDWRASTSLSYSAGYTNLGDAMFLITTNGGLQTGANAAAAKIFSSSCVGFAYSNILRDTVLGNTIPWWPTRASGQGGGTLIYHPTEAINIIAEDFVATSSNGVALLIGMNADFSQQPSQGHNYEVRTPGYILNTNSWGGTHSALGFDNGYRTNPTNREPWAGAYVGVATTDPFFLNVDYGTNAAGTNWPLANQKIFQLTRDNLMRFWANVDGYPTNEAANPVEHFHYGDSNITFNVPLTLSGVPINAWSDIPATGVSSGVTNQWRTDATNAASGLTANLNRLSTSNVVVVCDGDSNTFEDGSHNNWPWYLSQLSFCSNRCVVFTNFAVSGSGLDGAIGVTNRYATNGHALRPTASQRGFYILQIGVNDLADTLTTWETIHSNLCYTARADGYTVICLTFPRDAASGKSETPDSATWRKAESMNAWLRGNHAVWDRLVDLRSMFPDPYDSTWIYSVDRLHLMAPAKVLVAQAVNAAMIADASCPLIVGNFVADFVKTNLAFSTNATEALQRLGLSDFTRTNLATAATPAAARTALEITAANVANATNTITLGAGDGRYITTFPDMVQRPPGFASGYAHCWLLNTNSSYKNLVWTVDSTQHFNRTNIECRLLFCVTNETYVSTYFMCNKTDATVSGVDPAAAVLGTGATTNYVWTSWGKFPGTTLTDPTWFTLGTGSVALTNGIWFMAAQLRFY